MPINHKLNQTIFFALFCLAAFTFTSISLSAAFHILIIIPGVYLTQKYMRTSEFKFSKSSLLLFLIIIWSMISVFANWSEIQNPLHNLKKLKYLIIGLISVPTFDYFFKQVENLKKSKVLLNTFIIATTLASLSGLIAYYSGFNPLKMKPACHATRTCGMYGMYMTYGYGIAFVLTLLTGMLLKYKSLKNFINPKLLVVSYVINFVSFLLSFARGAYIGYFISIPFFFFQKNKKKFVIICASLVLLGGLSLAFIPKVKELVSSRSRVESIMIRFSQYEAAWIAAKENPVFGLGYKNFEANSNLIKKEHNLDFQYFRGHGHSNFFEHLASTGFIGLVLLLLFHIFWTIETYKRKDLIGFVLFPFTINFFFSGQFQYTFGDGENLFLIMALYALSQINLRVNETQHNP